MRALRRNPARRAAERQIWTVIAVGALTALLSLVAISALVPGAAETDGDLLLLLGALAFGLSVQLADRWRRHH